MRAQHTHGGDPWSVSDPGLPQTAIARATSPILEKTNAPQVSQPVLTPTPNEPRILPTLRANPEQYFVEGGDTLATIARAYNISLQTLIDANQLENPDYLEVGQELVIPVPVPGLPGTGFKVIPDAELVFSPSTVDFDPAEFIISQRGYLAGYEEEVEGRTLSGTEIVERIARDFSVNPGFCWLS